MCELPVYSCLHPDTDTPISVEPLLATGAKFIHELQPVGMWLSAENRIRETVTSGAIPPESCETFSQTPPDTWECATDKMEGYQASAALTSGVGTYSDRVRLGGRNTTRIYDALLVAGATECTCNRVQVIEWICNFPEALAPAYRQYVTHTMDATVEIRFDGNLDLIYSKSNAAGITRTIPPP